MIYLKFSVDKELRLRGWETGEPQLTDGLSAEFAALPYFQVRPRIVFDGEDAVARVVQGGMPLHLRDYREYCFCGEIVADIVIEPVLGPGSEVSGADVTIKADPKCLLSQKLSESKPLIDIGKSSAGLAHGVRNPLNAIKGSIVYLRGKYGSDADFLEFSGIIEAEISKLDKFITKFLSGSLRKVVTNAVDVACMLDRIVIMANMQAHDRKIEFHRSDGDIPPVNTDFFQLEQALLNIMNNAVESIPDSGSISVRTSVTEIDNLDYVTIEIADSGRGFESRNAANSLRTESTAKGRGFGLFLSHEIVKNLGGSLDITSTKMAGTTVKIHIPQELPRE